MVRGINTPHRCNVFFFLIFETLVIDIRFVSSFRKLGASLEMVKLASNLPVMQIMALGARMIYLATRYTVLFSAFFGMSSIFSIYSQAPLLFEGNLSIMIATFSPSPGLHSPLQYCALTVVYQYETVAPYCPTFQWNRA